jgi:iron-sulfur cluster assembly accessory protein
MLITAKAKEKVKEFLSKSPNKVFRIAVSSGGCSGFQYLTEITDSRENDITISEQTVTDPQSNKMLENVIVDYIVTLDYAGFIFSNPGASSTCGCGKSFDN